jgi:CRP-like cAMP-binding protein
MKRITIKAGEYLYYEGDDAIHAFLLLEGEIAFFQGRERVLDAKRGRFFGDMKIFKEGQYPATAVAVSDAVLLQFTGEQLLDHLQENRENLKAYLIDVEDRVEEIVSLLMGERARGSKR